MNLPLSRARLLGLAAVSVAAASVSAQSTLSQYGEIVQAVGDPIVTAPGVTPAPGATIFATNNFDSPYIDQNGTVLYRARFTGGGAAATDDRGLFMGRASGDVQMVVRAGDQAPGQPVGTLLRSSTSSAGLGGSGAPLRISPFNEYLFFASSLYDPTTPANTPATSDTALFWGPPGGLLTIAREGTLAGGTFPAGATWLTNFAGSNQYNHVNSAGQVLFTGQLAGGPVTTADDNVLVTGFPGALTAVIREGDAAPAGLLTAGTEIITPTSGTTMGFVQQLNEAGQVLHEVRFSTTLGSATTANDRALAVWTGGTDVYIAREGQQAPGLPAGDIFGNASASWSPAVGGAAFSRAGKTIMQTELTGGTTTTLNNQAIYFGGPGPFTAADLVIRKGDLVPTLGGGETFSGAGSAGMTCNDTGFAFVGFLVQGGSVTASNDSGIFYGNDAATLGMLVREGDAVPAGLLTGGPWTFGAFANGTNNPILNYSGAMFFQAGVTDGVNTKNIWLSYTPTAGLRLLLDAGDTFTTSQGTDTWTTVSSNAGSGGSDGGGQSHFNNQGDFVVRPSFGSPVTAAIIRGHVGTMICEPSSVPVTGGVPQNFHIDAGIGHPFELYVVLATSLGTRPGFFSPFGPQNIPLNPDALWTDLSLQAANSVVWVNNLGITDASGKGIGAAGFVMPPGYPGFQGTTLHHACVLLDFSLTQTHVSEPSALKLY